MYARRVGVSQFVSTEDATDLPGHGEKAEIDQALLWSEEEGDSRAKDFLTRSSSSVVHHEGGLLPLLRREVFGVAVSVVPGARIELATPAFSGRRSTNELPRHR